MFSITESWIGIFIIGIILFFILRNVNLWYWKINDFKEGQDEQIRLLKIIAGIEEETKEEAGEIIEEVKEKPSSGWKKST